MTIYLDIMAKVWYYKRYIKYCRIILTQIDMDNINIIKDLGLNDHEAEMYLNLLKSGGVLAAQAARGLGIKRTTAYPILQSLATKGLVNVYFRKNRRYYYAQKPDRLAGLFRRKLESFESLIPLLESFEKKQITQFGLRFIETVEELKQFYGGILDEYDQKKNKEYQIIGNSSVWEGLAPEFFVNYRKERAFRKIKTKLLLSADSVPHNPTGDALLREYKYISEKYRFRSTIDIFDEKVLIVSPQLSSLAVVVAVPAMVDVFKSVFEIIWDTLP